MTPRLVVSWVAFTVAVQAGFYWFRNAMAPGLYLDTDLVLLMALLMAPAAQWGALRMAGVPWRGEWFTASLIGGVASSTLLNLLWSRVPMAMPLPALLLIASDVCEALLQWVVLRAHVRRASIWFAAVAATIASTFLLRWLMTGIAMPVALPDRLWARLAIPVTAALIQGLCFSWLLMSRRPDEVPLRSKPAWFVVEWTMAASMAMVIIMGAWTVLGRGAGARLQMRLVLLMPLLAGIVIGALQWMLLRRRLPLGWSWVVVSAASMVVPALGILVPAVMMYAVQLWFVTLTTPFGFAFIGAWMGLAQWFVLRRHVAFALFWVPASALAWSGWNLYRYGVTSLTIAVLGGLVTGTVMAVLLGHTRPAPARASGARSRLAFER